MRQVLLLLLLMFTFQNEVKADGWNVNRNLCLGALYYKYHSFANASYFSNVHYQGGYDCLGRYVGGPFVKLVRVDSKESKSCSRPTEAIAQGSGFTYDEYNSGCYKQFVQTNDWYYAYVKSSNTTSGWSVLLDVIGKGHGGNEGEFLINERENKKLESDGFSFGNIEGGVIIVNKNNFYIPDVDGRLTVAKEKDFYSTFKIIAIVERNDYTENEASLQDSLLSKGVFENIVYSAEITVTKNEIYKTGLFSEISNEIKLINNEKEIGISFNKLELSQKLDIRLEDNEELTIITYIDGGFDISSALNNSETYNLNVILDENLIIDLYPNPSSDFINLSIGNTKYDSYVIIDIYDVSGRKLDRFYDNIIANSNNIIKKIDISKYNSGVYFMEIKTKDEVLKKKFLKK